MTGARALLEMLRSAGVDRLFGNPGTTELPLLDELVSFEGLEYDLVLQEGVAVGMADGYAQARGQIGALSLHATGGVANAVGLLYNAGRAGTPLLVLSGQQDSRLALQEPFLHSDMVRWMRPLVKWAYEVAHPHDLARALRRAIAEATTPPAGPVFLAVPLDVLRADDVRPEDVAPRRALAAIPEAGAVEAAARVLRFARSPVIVAGDRVAHAGAEGELRILAEETGWPVFLEPYPTRFVFPTHHPLARGALPRFAAGVRARLGDAGAVLICGMTPFEHFLYDGTPPLPEGVSLVHLDLAPDPIGRHHPVAIGVAGDLRFTLRELRRHLGASPPGARPTTVPSTRGPQESAAVPRILGVEDGRDPRSQSALLAGGAAGTGGPYEAVADAVASVLGSEDILVEEAISGRAAVLARIPRSVPGTFFGEKGGTIGWGFPAALGVKLARPNRRVLAIVGDGSLLMEIQGLWTAARRGIAVVAVVLNNGGYTILKEGLASLGGQAARAKRYPGADVPGVDLCGLARSLGVRAERIALSDDSGTSHLAGAIDRALTAGVPFVLDVTIDAPVRPLA